MARGRETTTVTAETMLSDFRCLTHHFGTWWRNNMLCVFFLLIFYHLSLEMFDILQVFIFTGSLTCLLLVRRLTYNTFLPSYIFVDIPNFLHYTVLVDMERLGYLATVLTANSLLQHRLSEHVWGVGNTIYWLHSTVEHVPYVVVTHSVVNGLSKLLC